MKTVLVLTDFSDNAWNALFTALKLHEKNKVRFLIMNCYEPTFAPVLGHKSKERLAVIYDSLSLHSQKQLTETNDYLKKHHHNNNHQFSSISIEGEIIDSVKDVLRDYDVDLIVMGTRGATRSREVYMGRNTVKVIKKIRNCPILAIPADHDFKVLRRIVFPTDFSRSYADREISPLRDLALMWNSIITVFQVTEGLELKEEQLRNKSVLERRLKGINLQYQSVPWNTNIKQAVLNEVEEERADMIALIYYTHTFLERLTREPVVKKMAFHTSVPLLILPELD